VSAECALLQFDTRKCANGFCLIDNSTRKKKDVIFVSNTTDSSTLAAHSSVIILPKAEIIEESSPLEPAEKAQSDQSSAVVIQSSFTRSEKFVSKLPDWVVAFKPDTSVRNPLGKAKWWIYAWTKLYAVAWISPPSTIVGERRIIQENEIYALNARDEISGVICTTSNNGGSSKSTVIQWLGASLGQGLRSRPALLGMDIGADKTVLRFKQNESEILSVSELINMNKQGKLFSPRDLQGMTKTDAASGMVLFKAIQPDEATRDFAISDTIKVIKYVRELYPLTLIDGGPGLNQRSNDGVLQVADIALITNRGISQEAMVNIRATLHHPNYNLVARRDKVIVVISAVKPKQFNTRTQFYVAEQCGVDPDNVVLIPYDRYLDDHVMVNLKRIHLSALSVRTRRMFSHLERRVIDILRESRANRQIRSIPTITTTNPGGNNE
jgi:MinD-like ATPase involved in chromosome partitioning or flagellar assembly